MMKKRKLARWVTAVSLALAAIIAATSVGCQAPDGIAQIQFISGSPTGGWFPVTSAVADLTNALYEGHPISVIPGAGGVGNPLRVGSGQSDIGLSYGPFLRLAREGGNETYQKAYPNLRAVSAMITNKLHLIRSGDSDDSGLARLTSEKPRLRVGTGPVGSAELFVFGEVLKRYGASYDDIEHWGGRVDRVNTGGRSDAWRNRQLDLVSFFINDPAPRVIELLSARDSSRLVNLDEHVRQGLAGDWGMLDLRIPADRYPNQHEDVRTVGMPYVVFTTTELDADIVYNLTRVIAENRERLVAAHSAFQDWEPEDMLHGVGIAFHEGAERYYRERGWIE